jgi:zinc protease
LQVGACLSGGAKIERGHAGAASVFQPFASQGCRPDVPYPSGSLLLTERFGSAGTLAAAEPGMQLLPTGMALILIPNCTPTVSVRLLVPAGGRDDPRGLEGLAHYVEHLIASDPGALGGGAADRGAPRLRAHGPANAFTSLNRTVYLLEVSPNALEGALDLLAKRVAVLDASAAVALREQNVVRQEYFWRYGKTQRLPLYSQLSMRLGLTDRWNIGTPDTIARFSLEPARAFWQQQYAPQAMTLVI